MRTLPVRGATLCHSELSEAIEKYAHAPRAGSDTGVKKGNGSYFINMRTLPVRGATVRGELI